MDLNQGREIAKQAMIQSLIQNQGYTYDQALKYAEARLAAAVPDPVDEVMADNPLGTSFPDIPAPQIEPTAPQVATRPETAAPASPAVASPSSSTALEEPPSIFDNPEAVDAVLGMGGRNREIEYAQSIRDMATPEGRYVSNGRIYTAANPLEHLARGYGAYKGGKEVKRLEGEQEAAKKMLIDALRGKKEDPEDELLGSPGYGVPA